MAAAARCHSPLVGQGCERPKLRRYREVSLKVLVLGGAGQVGRAVVDTAPLRHEVMVKTRAELDIGDALAIEKAVAESRADWIVNAAAYTAVDLAEEQGAQAIAVNDTAVGVLTDA